MAEDQQSAREAGMNDFLAKPISLEGIERALATAHTALCPTDWSI
jgi:CheY-like chemotaxis protein